MDDAAALAWLGSPIVAVVVGAAFGVGAERMQLCTMGAVADAVIFDSWRRARIWAAMIAAVGLVLGTAAALGGGVLAAPVTTSAGALALVAVGGGAFGAGMVLAGGCLSRAWLRAASGSLRSLVLIVVALLCAWPIAAVVAPRLDGRLEVPAVLVVGIAAAILCWILRDGRFRAAGGPLWGGLLLGALIAVAALPQAAASIRFVPVAAPVTTPLGSGVVVLLAATTLGAFASAVAAGRFRLEVTLMGPDWVRAYAGTVLMGVGGGLVGGGTIAVGTHGVGVLAPMAILAMVTMVAAAALVVRLMLADAGSWLGRGWRRVIGGSP